MTEREFNFGERGRTSTLIEDPRFIDEPIQQSFLDYWQSKLNGRPLPLRSSLVPKEVRSNLQWLIVADALKDFADFRFRLVGSRICDYYGSNSTGKTVREAYAASEKIKNMILLLCGWSCTTRLPIRNSNPSSSWQQTFYPAHDALYMPYSSDGEHADRVVIVFVYDRVTFRKERAISAVASVGP